MMTPTRALASPLVLALLARAIFSCSSYTTIPGAFLTHSTINKSSSSPTRVTRRLSNLIGKATAAPEDNETVKSAVPPPTFDGKVVFPARIISAGLFGHKVPAVYAILNGGFKRGSGDGWEHCECVGISRNLSLTLKAHMESHGSDVCHIRAVSFTYPRLAAMEIQANEWEQLAMEAGGNFAENKESGKWSEGVDEIIKVETEEKEISIPQMDASAYLFDEDDDDDYEDDDDDYNFQPPEITTVSDEVVSPFTEDESDDDDVPTPAVPTPAVDDTEENLPLTAENVDKVLDEVRPYLVSDGGNVSVQRVDDETRNVYLVLEGACGSCPSSTVTMKMGIERVLKENFPNLGEVLAVDNNKPSELTLEIVEQEVGRLKQAITAMGGVIRVVNVDTELGVVELNFRGANKVRQGLELAILDVPLVNHVKFVNDE